MDKEMESEERESEVDSYEFIDGKPDINDTESRERNEDSVNSSHQMPQRTVSLDSEVRLSPKETFLANRVRELQQENEELKKAIKINGDALKLCVNNLNIWKNKQYESHNNWCKKYEQARITVTKLQEEISSLKQDNAQLKAKETIQAKDNDTEKLNECQSPENTCMAFINVNKTIDSLEKQITHFLSLSADDQQQLTLEEIQKAIKPSLMQAGGASSFQEQLESKKAKCDDLEESLELEKHKRLELEKENNELKRHVETLEKLSNGSVDVGTVGDMRELNKEVRLLEGDMARMEQIAAGYVSHDSETPNESYAINQNMIGKSVSSTSSHELEEKNRALKEENTKLTKEAGKRETAFLDNIEKMMKEIRTKDETLKTFKENESVVQQRLQDTSLKNSALEDEVQKKEEMIEALHKKQTELEVAIKQEISNKISEKANHQIETLKSQICVFNKELQAKEKETDVWRAQEHDYRQRIMNMELNFAKMKEDLNSSHSARIETRKELTTLYNQHEQLLAQHDKLVAENQSVRGTSGAEIVKYQSEIDNLTAQLLSAEEMVENKDQDYRKLQQDHANLTSELEVMGILKQQVDIFQRDFNAEKQVKIEREQECRRLNEELQRMQAENEKLLEDLNDPTGSRMAELQRRHGNTDHSSWNVLYDQFLAPRGPPTRNISTPRQGEAALNRQVSGGACPKCERAFSDLDELQTHVVQCLESDSSSTGVERVCPKCQESFPDLDTLQIHVMECLDN